MTTEYKETIALPKTSFPMKAGLPVREPELLARWAEQNLWEKIRKNSVGREKFILHDGPPYANGHLHIGHALNKILKDMIIRSQQMLGKDANYIPGWDCHGLPIEWKIEEKYRAAGKDKDSVSIIEFRRQCRAFADKWVAIQKQEFKRLGVQGEWDNPYLTMTYRAEAQIAREIGKFLINGGLFKGSKPVLWSVVEKTALAEAEVEYQEHKSTTLFIRFPVINPGSALLDGAAIVIWTTTPWTLPGNRAIAFHRDIDYSVYHVQEVDAQSPVCVGDKLVLGDILAEDLRQRFKISGWERLGAAEGLGESICAHPLRGQGYEFDVPVHHGDFVTIEQGTGFVHIGPGHGMDDFIFARKHGVEIPHTIAEDGSFYPSVPLFAGKVIYTQDGKAGDANGRVIKALLEAGALLAKENIRHSYPHSWRSKAPLIFRNTAQWFISMETNGLREKALRAIEATAFYPQQEKKRLYSMVKERPDWCISRQRAWGVPIPIFMSRQTGEPLRDQAVIDRIAEAFETEGADAWFASDPSRFLGDNYNPEDYTQVRDVVDVWFDSGSTHAFVLEDRPDQKWPADLYLEGSDQHRGWFHSSLLESCGTRGRAPYDGVLTHGFVMAEDGRKMSKSLGNVVVPAEVNDKMGAETLRLWVVASNYSEDLRIGPEILKKQTDSYRRLRNTLRWLLGNLAHFESEKRVQPADMPELERWVLNRLWEMDKTIRETAASYDFNRMFRDLHDFCAFDLSAFYFDIRKDSLYCDSPDAPKRLAALSVLDEIFSCLTAWFAPILCFTAEEAWLTRTGTAADNSVHLRRYPDLPEEWRDQMLADKWAVIRNVRRVVTGALEIERAEKRIGSSLQAHPVLHVSGDILALLKDVDMAEISITSGITLDDSPAVEGAFTLAEVADVAVVPHPAEGEKCERCWKMLPDIGLHADHPAVCGRCADAVASLSAAAE